MSSESLPGTTAYTSPEPARVEQTTARYLFAISTLSAESDDRITTGELREFLDVAPASVTEMISKLDDEGFVDYEKYQGVTLTEQGENAVSNVSWRFCVVTSFFESALNATLESRRRSKSDTPFREKRFPVSMPVSTHRVSTSARNRDMVGTAVQRRTDDGLMLT